MKIAVIRIAGQVDLPPDVKKTLELLKLKRKFSCAIIEDKPELIGMIKKIQDYVMFGEITEETFQQLLLKRGKNEDEKIRVFHLHPPRGGFKKSSKLLWPKGILGKNEKINEFIIKML
ncbi:MAG: uL30 family ribosomal protein [Candidatus Pacearchaeota archaeon]|nr:uL30 family ribosomal protein [Candidatus Pacearchaeota archaeon]